MSMALWCAGSQRFAIKRSILQTIQLGDLVKLCCQRESKSDSRFGEMVVGQIYTTQKVG